MHDLILALIIYIELGLLIAIAVIALLGNKLKGFENFYVPLSWMLMYPLFSFRLIRRLKRSGKHA